MLTIRDVPPPPTRRAAPTRPRGRRPFRDNPLLILSSIVLLLVALGGTLTFANRSSRFSPDFLTEFVLYALSVADLTMILALVFVLARNIIKMMVERRRGLPFARFRSKLVGVLLGMTLIPAVLVLLVGSELIRSNVDRWFNAPLEEIVASANRTAADYYGERQKLVGDTADRVAKALAPLPFPNTEPEAVRDIISPEVVQQRISMLEVYRVVAGKAPRPEVESVVDVAAPSMPPDYDRASADRLAERVAAGRIESHVVPEPLGSGGELVRAAAPVRSSDGSLVGVVVASDFLTGELASRSRRMTDAYERYNKLKVLKNPLLGVYLSFFLMVTLMILVSATWMGLYLAARITRPVNRLSAAAREIGAGHLDHRLEPETSDEFGSLVEAFNTMASELSASRQELERSTVHLRRQHQEVEARRRYIETILDRITTGVISLDAGGRITTVNPAAGRLLGLGGEMAGRPVEDLLGRPDLQPLAALLTSEGPGGEPPPQEVALAREGRELHLAAVSTALYGEGGAIEGRLLVFDDITPLIRAQKVAAWREVARRLAHEIKNPLTPIQLCAERLGRHFQSSPPPTRQLVEECTKTIVGEVESLKSLVDEFSQFARMPAPRRIPTHLPQLVADTLALYVGLFREVRIESTSPPDMPMVRLDPEQIRRVLINLVDNAIEAMDRRGRVAIEIHHAATDRVVRLVVADNGPGIPEGDRERLFMPYYSTKRRGSGLGLAIVRRIVAEHGGSIDVTANSPQGTRFTIELPL